MSATDLELLSRYARHREEDAFAELVRRHLNLVHSAALRQVRAPELAEEVAQTVFSDLARQAERIPSGTVLAAWLYQVTRHRAIDVVRREASRRLRENVAHELHAMNACADDWVRIEPLLDEAMHALDDVDRSAVLLRYFENKSLREVGQQLGASEDAAQKRVSRAVERLREFFEKSGVTVGAGGIVVLLSAHAVQAAPAGLGPVIITSTALIGAKVAANIAAATTTPVAMNLLHAKSVVSIVASAFLAGTGIYWVQEHRAERLRAENAALINDHQLILEERDAARAQAALAEAELNNAREGRAELLRLRGQVGELQQQTNDLVRVRRQDRLRAVVSRAPTEDARDSSWVEQVLSGPLKQQGAAAGALRKKLLHRDTAGINGSEIALRDALLQRDLNSALEKSPVEFADFQSAFIQAALGIDDPARGQQIHDLIRHAYEQAVANGLDIPSKPATDAEAWVQRRFQLDRLTTAQLKQLLSEEEAKLFDRAFLGVMGVDLGGVGVDKSNYPPGFLGE